MALKFLLTQPIIVSYSLSIGRSKFQNRTRGARDLLEEIPVKEKKKRQKETSDHKSDICETERKGGIGQKEPQIGAQFLESVNQPMVCPHLGIRASSNTHTIVSDWLGAACKVWFYILAVVNPKINGQTFSSLCSPLQIPHGDIGVARIHGCHM